MNLEDVSGLASYLVEKWDYVPNQAPDVARKLLTLDKDIHTAFEEWVETGQFPEKPVFSGFSPRSLSDLAFLKPPAVFLLLDWIRREPADAITAINEELVG
ncbi:MAG: hypothetical protein BWY63_01074 [Chloroflexi bacterium ADurb.Bin360]|nr:MAG: hypothetical protein BWY63_01074 [Chloroflexi bacterium ADurb.Bin360]